MNRVARALLTFVATTAVVGQQPANGVQISEHVDDPKASPALPVRLNAYPLYAVPDKSVARWIRYYIIGPRNHPIPIVYISTRGDFKVTANFEEHIALSQRGYAVVATYTKQRIQGGECLSEKHLPKDNLLEVLDHHGTINQLCILPKLPACKYLTDMTQLDGVSWTSENQRLLDIIDTEMRCDKPAELRKSANHPVH